MTTLNPPLKPPPKPIALDMAPRKANPKLGAKVVLYAVPGWGKTTLAGYADKPYLIIAEETGYDQLVASGQLNEIPARVVTNWTEAVETANAVAAASSDLVKYLFLDALGGLERMCAAHVLRTDFDGDAGKYAAFGKGTTRTAQVFSELLVALDRVAQSGKHVVVLSHATVRKHENPDGKDWDTYVPDAHKDIGGRIVAWASDVLFGSYVVAVDEKGKASGGAARVVASQQSSGRVAKSQRGAKPFINVGSDPTQSFAQVFAFLNGVK
jgi:hypothetical protein